CPAPGYFEAPDALQNDCAHSSRLDSGRCNGGHRHGLAEVWLLVPGWYATDHPGSYILVDFNGIPLAPAVAQREQRDTVLADFRRQSNCEYFSMVSRPK